VGVRWGVSIALTRTVVIKEIVGNSLLQIGYYIK
jgi:hypothetical protein